MISELCTNEGKSQNRKLRKSFFTEALVMIDKNENAEIMHWKNKLVSITNAVRNSVTIQNIMNYKIIPYITGCRVKKLFSNTNINYKVCTSKIIHSYGFELILSEKIYCV